MARPKHNHLQRLLNEVIELSRPYGKKAELARFLNVERQHVNAWLKGQHEPSGGVALAIAEWVKLERDLKKKTRKARQRQPGRRPAKPNTSNEKQADRPQKR